METPPEASVLSVKIGNSLTIVPHAVYNVANWGQVMYSVNEAAEQLKVSPRRVRFLLAEGRLEGKKLGRDWVVLNLDYKRKRKPKRKKGGES